MHGLRPQSVRKWARGGQRGLSTAGSQFSRSLLLPKTRFPLRNDPARDDSIRRRTSGDLYRWQWENAKGPPFVLHDGPPYANGDLHMGHALNKIIKDIINRYHVMLGQRVHYVPGWDCHGLPIEQKVLRALKKDVDEVSSVTIRSEAEKYAKEQVASQREQFSSLGIMTTWEQNLTYRTMDHDYEMRQLRIFQKMVEQGLIFRQYRPVHYSPSSRSALAESELEYKDAHVSHSVYVTFDVELPGLEVVPAASRPLVKLLVWTTTPWTLTANMGIAVNPDMKYALASSSSTEGRKTFYIYAVDRQDALRPLLEEMGLDTVHEVMSGSEFLDARYYPLFSASENRETSKTIIPSSHVTPDSGTGVVHLAPAHGQEDYAIFRSHPNLDMLCHVDGKGHFTASVADVVGDKADRLVGKSVLSEGGKAMVDLLREIGALKKVERYKHRYPYDWKTDQPIIMMATSQWFANLDKIKDDAIAALQNVDFYPPVSRNRLESFVRSRSEWCISRQRVWGVPIPALYHLPTQRAVLTTESLSHILSVIDAKGTRHWWDGPVEEFVPPTLRIPGEDVSKTWAKGTDTMDVWFDSGTSWSMLEGLAREPTSQQVPGRYADVCVEGSDQHRGWFQSQLLTAVATAPPGRLPVAPYGTLITHGMVLDENDRKMSKSLGNILSPMTIINGGKNLQKEPAYGTDVLRLWAATVEVGRDMSVGPTLLSQCAQNYRKIRNTARFLLGNLGDRRLAEDEKVPREQLAMVDRWIVHKLSELEHTAREGYSTYNFPKVVTALSNFANITLSSLYFDITKDPLYCDGVGSMRRRSIVTVLEKVLDTMVHIMAPILPHLAEEVYQTRFPAGEQINSAFSEPWKPLSEEWSDPTLDTDMSELLRLRDVVLSLLEKPRQNKEIGSSLMADVDIVLPSNVPEGNHFVKLVKGEAESLSQLFNVSQVNLVDEGSLGTLSAAWVYTGSMSLPSVDEDLAVRVRPASSHKCPRCWAHTAEKEESLCRRCSSVVQP